MFVHTRVQIDRAHGMADHLGLLRYRCLVLVIIAAADPTVPAYIDEEAGLIEVSLDAGRPVEFDQCQLDLLMTVRLLPLACGFRPEDIAHQVREPGRDGEETRTPCCPVVRNRRLNHVSAAVELVLFLQIRPPIAHAIDRKVGIEVPVLILS